MSISQHPVQPQSSAGTMPLTPFVLLGAVWGAIVLTWLAWAAGATTAALTGRPGGPGFGGRFVVTLAHGQWSVLYPNVNRVVVAVVYGVFVAVAAVPVVAGWIVWERRRTHAGDPLPSLARPHEVAELTPAGVTKRARQLRPSLADTPGKQLRWPPPTGPTCGPPRTRRGQGPGGCGCSTRRASPGLPSPGGGTR